MAIPTARPSPLEPLLRVVPAIGSLRHYRAADARADFLAGITVAAVAVPQAMAYAMVAGLPAEYGLYTAIVMTAIGALFASSKQLINGPTNAISIAVLSVIAPVEPDQKLAAVVLIAFMVGTIQLGITVLRLGDLTRYISHSVIVGFTLGAGSLLVLDQVKNLFGFQAVGDVHDHFLIRFARSLFEGGGPQLETSAIGVGTIVLVLALRVLKRRLGWRLLPDLLLVVIAMAAIVGHYGLDARGVSVIGEIPAKLPSFQPPALDAVQIRAFSTGALAIAVLGLLEAVAMAKALAAPTREKVDMNQLCLSEGLANFGGSFFHCLPGSGSLTRSAINQQAGAATQWAGLVSAAAVAVIMLAFAPYARFIPRAALAGILMVSAYKMVDWRGLSYHIRTTRFDAAIVAVTAFSAVAISIEFCILIGVFLSFLLTVPRAGRMLLTEFVVTGDGGIHERLPEDTPCDRILVFGLEGEMFFGATAALESHFARIEERVTEHTSVLVLRVKRARNPDAVGMTTLESFLVRMQARGVHVLLCGVRQDFADKIERTGLAQRDWRADLPGAAGAPDEHDARDPTRLRVDPGRPAPPVRAATRARASSRSTTRSERRRGSSAQLRRRLLRDDVVHDARQQRSRQQAHPEVAAQPAPPADADRRLAAEPIESGGDDGVGRGARVRDLARDRLECSRRRARLDHQHVDAGPAQLRPQRLAEERDERLARRVGRVERHRLLRRERPREDQRAATARAHRRQQAVRERERRAAMHLHHLRESRLVLRFEAADAAEASVVDEHRDLEVGDRRGYARHAVRRSEIGDHHARRGVVCGCQLRRQYLEEFAAASAQHHRAAVAGERSRERRADSRRRARHQRPFAIAIAQRPSRPLEAVARPQQRRGEQRERQRAERALRDALDAAEVVDRPDRHGNRDLRDIEPRPRPQPRTHVPQAVRARRVDRPVQRLGRLRGVAAQHHAEPDLDVRRHRLPEKIEGHVDEGHVRAETEQRVHPPRATCQDVAKPGTHSPIPLVRRAR